MRAIVSGGGIAGLTLAWWLGRDGWEVLIVERAPALHDEGYMIDFMGSGWDVAERMDLIPKLRETAYDIPAVQWIDQRGRTSARIDYRQFTKLLRGRLATLMRGELERVLFDALPSTVEWRWAETIDTIESRGDSVEVTLSSGAHEPADLLVGADGIHSRVRALTFGGERQFRRDLGYHTAAYVFEDAAAVAELAGQFKIMALPGRQAGFYPLRHEKVAAFYAHAADREDLPADPVGRLREVYGDLDWLVPTGLAHAARLPSIYYDRISQIEMPRWTRGRVALIGDACDAVSLLAGQGASLAMATAYVLADELRHHETVDAALDAYGTRLIADVRKKQKGGRKTARWLVPRTRFDIALRNWSLRLAAMPGLSTILKPLLLSGTESVIRETSD